MQKISKSEEKQICSNDLKRLDLNIEISECEKHNQLNQLNCESLETGSSNMHKWKMRKR